MDLSLFYVLRLCFGHGILFTTSGYQLLAGGEVPSFVKIGANGSTGSIYTYQVQVKVPLVVTTQSQDFYATAKDTLSMTSFNFILLQLGFS